jgi:hypothetical protein
VTMDDDFLGSLQKGRAAAVEAERNRTEIKSVLGDLERQLNAMSPNRKLSVVNNSRTKTGDQLVPRGFGMAFEPPQKRYTALDVKADNGHYIELCEFNQGPRGYPIEMRYGQTIESIYDRTSLVGALRKVLESPHVGSFFNGILGVPDDAPIQEAVPPVTEDDTSGTSPATR